MKKFDVMDVLGGLLFCVLGLSAFFYARANYDLGDLSEMGPGLFPAYIGIIMFLLGIGISIQALRKHYQARSLNLRPMLAVVLGVVAFALIIERFGAIPAIFALVFIAAWPEPSLTFRRTMILATALVVIAYLVFKVGLSMNFYLIQGVL